MALKDMAGCSRVPASDRGSGLKQGLQCVSVTELECEGAGTARCSGVVVGDAGAIV